MLVTLALVSVLTQSARAADCTIAAPAGHDQLFRAQMRRDYDGFRKLYDRPCAQKDETVRKTEKAPSAIVNKRTRELMDGPCSEVFVLPAGGGMNELFYIELI